MQIQTRKQKKDIIISILYQNYLALSSTHQNNTQLNKYIIIFKNKICSAFSYLYYHSNLGFSQVS